MKNRFTFLAYYLIFWLAYFFFFKGVFLLYNESFTTKLKPDTIGGIFLFGAQPDLAAALGLCLLPFALISASFYYKPGPWLYKGLLLYTNAMVIFLTVLCTADLELYRIWGSRLDASPLIYLNTPSEMFISLGSSPIRMLIILNTLVNLFFCFAYRLILHPFVKKIKQHEKQLTAYPIAFMIIPIVGSFPFLPDIQRSAYFSEHYFANQAALNVPLNFFFSFHLSYNNQKNPYAYFREPVAESLLHTLLPDPAGKRQQLVRKKNPNVVLIIWESFTAKAATELQGIRGITPEFSKLSKEGLLFSNIYASGDRSDKGLVALLSGYPAQTGSSILKYPEKAGALPQLSESFQQAGYHTGFYYGGDLDFARFKNYLQKSAYEQIISVEDFNEEQRTSAWGAHDHVVFKKLLQDMDNRQEPFFNTIFTLSSHEPFDIPVKAKFAGRNVSKRLLSSLHYTDSTIGWFIRQAKTRPWYDNTLFIVVADHGHTYPGKSRIYEPEKFHIPMLWFGGALMEKPAKISKTMSQTDLAASLLGQLDLPAGDFPWSKDIFMDQTPSFAHYFFKNGVGFITDSSYLAFDNVSRKLIEQQGAADSSHLPLAQTYLQLSYGDYLNK